MGGRSRGRQKCLKPQRNAALGARRPKLITNRPLKIETRREKQDDHTSNHDITHLWKLQMIYSLKTNTNNVRKYWSSVHYSSPQTFIYSYFIGSIRGKTLVEFKVCGSPTFENLCLCSTSYFRFTDSNPRTTTKICVLKRQSYAIALGCYRAR